MKYVYKIGALVIFFILLVTIIPLGFSNIDLTHDVEKNTHLKKVDWNIKDIDSYILSDNFERSKNFSIAFWYCNDYLQNQNEDDISIFYLNSNGEESSITLDYQYGETFFDENTYFTLKIGGGYLNIKYLSFDFFNKNFVHFALTFQDKNITLYINGEIVEEMTTTYNYSNINFYYGYRNNDHFCNAYVSDVFLFNRTINETDLEKRGNYINSGFSDYSLYVNMTDRYKKGSLYLYDSMNETGSNKGNYFQLGQNLDTLEDKLIIETWEVTEQYNLMKNVIFIVLILLSIGIIYKIGIGEII